MEQKDSINNLEVDPALEILSEGKDEEQERTGDSAQNKEKVLERWKPGRLQFSREDLVSQIVEVQQIPEDLLKNLANNQKLNRKGPHVISLYPVKPVACQDEPYTQYHNLAYQERYKQRMKYSNYNRGDNENRKYGQREPNYTNDQDNAPNNHSQDNSPGKSSDQQQQQFLKIPLHLSIEEQMEFLKNLQNQGSKSNEQNQDDKKEESKSQVVHDKVADKAQTKVEKTEKRQGNKAKTRGDVNLDEENRELKSKMQRFITDEQDDLGSHQEKDKVKNGKAEVKLEQIVVEVDQIPRKSTENDRKPKTKATPIDAKNKEKCLEKPQEKSKEAKKESKTDRLTSKRSGSIGDAQNQKRDASNESDTGSWNNRKGNKFNKDQAQTPRQQGSDKKQNRAKENAPKMVYKVKESPQKAEKSPEVDVKEDQLADKADKRTRRSQNWKQQDEANEQEESVKLPEEEVKVEEKVQEEVAADASKDLPHSPADRADSTGELEQPNEDEDQAKELTQEHQSAEEQQLQKLTKSQRRKMNRRLQQESQPAPQPKNLYKSQQILNNKDKMPEVDESDYYYYDPTAANKIYVADGEEGQESYEVTNINAQGSNFKSKYGDHVKIKERQEQQAKATKKEAKPVEKLIRIVDAPKEKDDQKQKAAKKEDQKPKQPIVNKYKVDESKQKEQVKVNDMDQIMKQQQKEEQKLRDQQKRIGKQAKSKQEPENPDDIKSIFNAAAKANNGQSSKYVAPVDRDEIEVARKKKGFYQDEDQDPSQPNVKFNAYGMAIAGKGGAKDSVVKNEKESKIKSAGDNKKEQVKQKKIEDQIKNASKDVLPDESSDHEEQMKAEMNPAKLAKFEKKLKKKKKRKEMGSDYSSSDADDDFNVLPKSMQKKTSGPAVSAKKKGKKQESNLLSMFDEKSMKQKIKMALLDKE